MSHSNDNPSPLTLEERFDRAHNIHERADRDWNRIGMDARRRAMMKTGYDRKIWMKAAEHAFERAKEERLLAS